MPPSTTRLAAIAFCCAAALASGQAPPAPAQDSTYTFKSNVNVVLVPVIVRDKEGRAVGNLKKEDFQVFDNDKPQVISGFTIQTRANTETVSRPPQSATAWISRVLPRRQSNQRHCPTAS